MNADAAIDRIAASQAILDALGNGTYLEIGVNSGESFIPIRARRKWGVDPSYTLTGRRLFKYAVFSLLRIRVERLFLMTSDQFFATEQRMLEADGVDVCLVDGLHTYEQALKDVLNALTYLKPGGVVLMHDCNPSSEVIGRPAADIDEMIRQGIPHWRGAWSGDVWKAVVHLRSLRDDVRAFVLDCDTGLGVVTKGTPSTRLPYTEVQIRGLTYDALAADRSTLLGLEPPEAFDRFLRAHLEAR